ncbi:DUF805 domain-containing protein [Streptomyces sp. UNOB3_S3]|uniref:DUF805 domain-containing protein n=1 Tax=Streptomyces sp. UNOB3_S3 TaxID=2871682 RepID=UPI001E2C819D|nr:DUF805 domain-containing protein [Streptomyces sp. UNOB3_S3]MCC3775461.1 DUF805 domain-containing protein [Streptomyces sp. UNOB3_S3]
MNWYVDVLKKYAVFNGRARRQEYWMFTLVNTVISIVLAIADEVLGTQSVLGAVYMLAVLLPSLAVTVRRLHDTDRSGWWILIGLVPIVGWIVLLVFTCLDSTPHHNAHGPSPKHVPAY